MNERTSKQCGAREQVSAESKGANEAANRPVLTSRVLTLPKHRAASRLVFSMYLLISGIFVVTGGSVTTGVVIAGVVHGVRIRRSLLRRRDAKAQVMAAILQLLTRWKKNRR